MLLQNLSNGQASIYNLGLAHGHVRYTDIAKFYKHLFNCVKTMRKSDTHILCITNKGQDVETKHLVNLGFKRYSADDYLFYHIISKNDFLSGDKYQEFEKIRLEEEKRRKQLQEEQERQDAIEGRVPFELRKGDKVYARSSPNSRYLVIDVQADRYILIDHPGLWNREVTEFDYTDTSKSRYPYKKPAEWNRNQNHLRVAPE